MVVPDLQIRWIDDLGFSLIVYKTGLVSVLVYAVFCREQVVDWSCIDLENLFFLY